MIIIIIVIIIIISSMIMRSVSEPAERVLGPAGTWSFPCQRFWETCPYTVLKRVLPCRAKARYPFSQASDASAWCQACLVPRQTDLDRFEQSSESQCYQRNSISNGYVPRLRQAHVFDAYDKNNN